LTRVSIFQETMDCRIAPLARRSSNDVEETASVFRCAGPQGVSIEAENAL